jgi:hypothetical protein
MCNMQISMCVYVAVDSSFRSPQSFARKKLVQATIPTLLALLSVIVGVVAAVASAGCRVQAAKAARMIGQENIHKNE